MWGPAPDADRDCPAALAGWCPPPPAAETTSSCATVQTQALGLPTSEDAYEMHFMRCARIGLGCIAPCLTATGSGLDLRSTTLAVAKII